MCVGLRSERIGTALISGSWFVRQLQPLGHRVVAMHGHRHIDVIDAPVCHYALAVMATAGLYETSGDWLYDIGLPGKSGISGGIVTVSPGKGGLGTFAPPLDSAGNSVKGQLVAKFLSQGWEWICSSRSLKAEESRLHVTVTVPSSSPPCSPIKRGPEARVGRLQSSRAGADGRPAYCSGITMENP
jgi:hypothetical protein